MHIVTDPIISARQNWRQGTIHKKLEMFELHADALTLQQHQEFVKKLWLFSSKMELIKGLFHLSGELCLLSPCAVNYQMAEVHCELHN